MRFVLFVCLTLAPCVGTQRQDTWYSDTGVDLVKTIDKETREGCSWNQCKSALPKPKDKDTKTRFYFNLHPSNQDEIFLPGDWKSNHNLKDMEACESCSWMQWRNSFLLQNFNPQLCTASHPPVLQSILLSSLLNPIWDWGILHWSLIRVQKVHTQDLGASSDLKFYGFGQVSPFPLFNWFYLK